MGIIQNFYKNYESAVDFSGVSEIEFAPEFNGKELFRIRLNAKSILALTTLAVALVIISAFFMDPTLSLLLAMLVLDCGLGIPFYLQDKKISEIEQHLPDVLHHMGTTLKTGGTIETALKEVSRANHGPITAGLKEMLVQINEGSTFEDSFSIFAAKSKSKMLQKAAVIIIAARRSGGALLETLSAMGEDFRAIYRLDRERKTKTFMQFLFILVAGCGVAPFVFGIVKAVLSILVSVGGSSTPETVALVAQFDMLFKVYIILQASLSVIGAVQVREGKISKAFIYIPIGAIISYFIYNALSAVFLSLLGLR